MRRAGLSGSDGFLLGHCGAESGRGGGARQMTRAGYSEPKISPGVSRSKWLSSRSTSRDYGHALSSYATQGREVRAGSWEETV